MPFCVKCGNENPAGVRFCSKCGTEQVANVIGCSNCGKELGANEKFCSACGTPAGDKAVPKSKPESQAPPKPKEEKLTKEGRKIISGGPKPSTNKQVPPSPTPPSRPPQKKKRGCMGCFFKTILILIVLFVAIVTVLYYTTDWWDDYKTEQSFDKLDLEGVDGIVDIEPDKKNNSRPTKDVELGIKIPVEINGKSISKETLKVSENSTVANFKKVKVDFGQFILGKETSVNVEEYAEQIIDGECSVVAYDIDLKGKSQFDDYITISLPYNEAFIQNGKAEECVAPHYYNSKTKNWEPVLYELDTKNKRVNIFTNHLSRYGVFTVKNATKRNAFVTGVYIPDRFLLDDKKGLHLDILANYYKNNKELGEEAFNHGLSFWGKFSGHSGVAINTLTVGGSYSTEFIGKLNEGFKNLGYVASVVQLGYDLYYSDKESRNKTTAINLTKNIMNQLVAEFGTPAINVAFIGVYIIDVTLNEFGNAMLAQKYKELWQVYDYYNRNYNQRSLKEWRALMIEIHKDNPKDPSAAYEEIMEEIENYAWKFMEATNIGTDNENTAELNSLAGEAGLKRMAWPSKKDKNGVYDEGKQRIIDKLYPVFNSVNKWRLNNLKMELTKEASQLSKELNKRISLTITENLKNGEKANYGGYRVAIRPLAETADKRQWTGTLNKQGYIKTSMTLIGYLLAGEPNKIEVYNPKDTPDQDQPVLQKEFVLDPNGTIVYLGKEKSNVAAGTITLFHEHTKNKAATSKYAVNDPLEVIAEVRDFSININKDGSFTTSIPGQKFEVYYGEKKGALYEGYVFNAGNIRLSGNIDLKAMNDAVESGNCGAGMIKEACKVGTMSYNSSGNLVEKEIINASSWGKADYARIIQDYNHFTQANFDLYVSGSRGQKDSYKLYASTEDGKYTIKNNPSADEQKKGYSNIKYSNIINFKIIIK